MSKHRQAPRRLEIRPDFPTIKAGDRHFLARLDAELAKQKTTLARAGKIYIAFPQKHPGRLPGHWSSAGAVAVEFAKVLATEQPQVQWPLAYALTETVHLARTSHQDSLHALTSAQHYRVLSSAALKKYFPQAARPFHFRQPDGARPHYFIVTDSAMEQGTTMANLVSFIQARGGHVLAAVNHSGGGGSLAQRNLRFAEQPALSAPFNDAGRNTAALPAVAQAFSRATGGAWTPQLCLEKFERALRRHGHTVFALTQGECERLVETVTRGYHGQRPMDFRTLLTELRARPRDRENYATKAPAP